MRTKKRNINSSIMILVGSILILFVILIAMTGCENLESSADENKNLVLNAYLYEDEPVTSIRLSETLPYTSTDTVFPLISDAIIHIQTEGVSYALNASDSAGYYHCPDSNLKITAGETYAIEVLHSEHLLSAEATVPQKPDSMKLSATTIGIDPDLTPWEMRQTGMPELEVTWSNPDGEYFYVLIENIEANPEDIEFGFAGPMGARNFRFLSQPFITDSYVIRILMSVQQYGTHRVKLFRVNQEYADLYENREQDSRNLSEPLTNVENGLGIFTAFSYDVAYFEVVKL